ncbi:MAG: cytochrome c maturation protein CcmE [Paracoccaceae bacterium]|jgi:cytochrome c-type biogenesis protein CcmE|nr:cytochrome c maturation protein CcmE [Paracoccaceae bacterium]
MKGLKKQRRIQVIVLAVVAMVASFVAFYLAAPDALQFFRAPSEVIAEAPAASETFRLGGLVEVGTLKRGEGASVTFRVTDGAASVPVRYTGVLPDLFAENQGMIATGKLVNGTFEAIEILAKHDETYMPREVIDALKEQGVYVDPNAGAATN